MANTAYKEDILKRHVQEDLDPVSGNVGAYTVPTIRDQVTGLMTGLGVGRGSNASGTSGGRGRDRRRSHRQPVSDWVAQSVGHGKPVPDQPKSILRPAVFQPTGGPRTDGAIPLEYLRATDPRGTKQAERWQGVRPKDLPPQDDPQTKTTHTSQVPLLQAQIQNLEDELGQLRLCASSFKDQDAQLSVEQASLKVDIKLAELKQALRTGRVTERKVSVKPRRDPVIRETLDPDAEVFTEPTFLTGYTQSGAHVASQVQQNFAQAGDNKDALRTPPRPPPMEEGEWSFSRAGDSEGEEDASRFRRSDLSWKPKKDVQDQGRILREGKGKLGYCTASVVTNPMAVPSGTSTPNPPPQNQYVTVEMMQQMMQQVTQNISNHVASLLCPSTTQNPIQNPVTMVGTGYLPVVQPQTTMSAPVGSTVASGGYSTAATHSTRSSTGVGQRFSGEFTRVLEEASMEQTVDILQQAVKNQGLNPGEAGRILLERSRISYENQSGRSKEVLSPPAVTWADEMVTYYQRSAGVNVDPRHRPASVFGGGDTFTYQGSTRLGRDPLDCEPPRILEAFQTQARPRQVQDRLEGRDGGSRDNEPARSRSEPVRSFDVRNWQGYEARDIRAQVSFNPQDTFVPQTVTTQAVPVVNPFVTSTPGHQPLDVLDPLNISRPWPGQSGQAGNVTFGPSGERPPGPNQPYPAGYDGPRDVRRTGRDYGDRDDYGYGGRRGRDRYYEDYEEKTRRKEATQALHNLTFDGSSSPNSITWEYFADRFCLAVELGQWDDAGKKLRLLSCLKGAASKSISFLRRDAPIAQVWETLRQRYSAIGQESSYELQLSKCVRDLNKDTPQKFLDDVSYLCRNAFPRSSPYDLEQSIKKYFLLGHPKAYRNHLNASVNLAKEGNLPELVQACRQYEQMEAQYNLVSAKKPAIRGAGNTPSERAVAVLGATDSSTSSEDSDRYSREVEVFRASAKKGRKGKSEHKHSKPKTTGAQIQVMEAASSIFGGIPEDGSLIHSTEDPMDLSDYTEDYLDDQVSMATAHIARIMPPGASAGNFYRNSGDDRPNNARFRNIICLYCRKRGHTIRYCRTLWRQYPDGRFPPEVTDRIMSALMSPRTEIQMRRREPPRTGRSSKARQNVQAIAAPPTPGEDDGGSVVSDTTSGKGNSQGAYA